jgi:hypothetical protein
MRDRDEFHIDFRRNGGFDAFEGASVIDKIFKMVKNRPLFSGMLKGLTQLFQ